MSYVKQAKEALDRGDTAASLLHCSHGLDSDPTNYPLLLIQAAAHKQDRNWLECESSLLKAIQAQPRMPSAWQGLLQVADEILGARDTDKKGKEKWERKREECLVVLMEVAAVELKRVEFLERLLNIYTTTDRHLLAADFVKASDQERYKAILRLWEEKTVKEQVEKGKFRLGADPLPILTAKTTAKVYLESPLTDLLGERELFDRLYLICTSLSSEQSASRLKQLLDKCDSRTFDGPTAKQLKMDLLDEPAVDCRDEGTLNSLLSKANAQRTMAAVFSARERLSAIERCFFVDLANSKIYLDRLEGLVMAAEGRHSEAVAVLEPLTGDAEVRRALLGAYEALGEYEKAVAICDDLTNKCKLLCQLGRYSDVKEALTGNSDDHERQLLLGVAEWHQSDSRQGAYDHFISSAKLNPSYAAAFTWLGKYYREQPGEEQRAEKCFRKALSLNPSDHQAALHLATYALQRHQHLHVVALLEPVTRDYPHDHDSWRLLGVAYFYLQSFGKAAHALHLCLRGSHGGGRILLLLGHAYAFEGRLKAAGRAFSAVISGADGEEGSSVVTAKIALARIKCRLFEFDEAIAILEPLAIDGKLSDGKLSDGKLSDGKLSDGKLSDGCRRELAYCLTRAVRHSLSHYYSKPLARTYLVKLRELQITDPYFLAETLQLGAICDDSVSTVGKQVVALLLSALEGSSQSGKAKIHAHLAHQYHAIGDYKSATEHAAVACRLPLSEHDCLYAVLLGKSGSEELAERHYSRAIANSHDNPRTAYLYANLGFLYRTAGKSALSRLAFEQARLVDADACGESLYGLAGGGDSVVAWELVADAARSLFVHHHVTGELLKGQWGDCDEMMLRAGPIVDRLAGMSREYLDLQHLIHTRLYTQHPTTTTASTDPTTLAHKRSIAVHTNTLSAFLTHHPFDLPAYLALLDDDRVPVAERLAFVGSKLRVLEERYEGREGSMRRHFEQVRQFEAVKRWHVSLSFCHCVSHLPLCEPSAIVCE